MTRVRHMARTKARVIELDAAGWGPKDIQRLLAAEDVDPIPTENAIWLWTNPEKAAVQAKRNVELARRWRLERASFAWPGVRGPEWKVARMRVLAGAGLKPAAIAAVMAVDFPKDERLSEDSVRRALESGRPPRSVRSGS